MPQQINFTRQDQRHVEMTLYSDQDLDAAAQISNEDVTRAESYWRAKLPRRFRNLLDALSTVRR